MEHVGQILGMTTYKINGGTLHTHHTFQLSVALGYFCKLGAPPAQKKVDLKFQFDWSTWFPSIGEFNAMLTGETCFTDSRYIYILYIYIIYKYILYRHIYFGHLRFTRSHPWLGQGWHGMWYLEYVRLKANFSKRYLEVEEADVINFPYIPVAWSPENLQL